MVLKAERKGMIKVKYGEKFLVDSVWVQNLRVYALRGEQIY